MSDGQTDRTKVRLGLVIISVVVLAAIVLFFVIGDSVGKAVMFAVALVGIIRVVLLARSLREQGH